jgi:hypothetical protein
MLFIYTLMIRQCFSKNWTNLWRHIFMIEYDRADRDLYHVKAIIESL